MAQSSIDTIKERSPIDRDFFRYVALFLIGIANALPLPLMGTTMSIWLSEEGFDRSTIGLFALVHLPFSLRLFWVPFVDCGWRRKTWVTITLLAMAGCLMALSCVDVGTYPKSFAAILLLLSFVSGGFYVAGLVYELESIDEKRYSMGSACIAMGYRIGLVAAGAGALYLATYCSWGASFKGAALLVLAMAIYLWIMPEPFKSAKTLEEKHARIRQYRSCTYGLFQEMIFKPCRAFFSGGHWKIIMAFLLLFKTGNHLMKSMEGPFYLSLGLSKIEIASIVKIWGLLATIGGSLLGGLWFRGRNHFQALAHVSLINLLALGSFWVLALTGRDYVALYLVIAIEHLVGGLAITAFIFFLWRVCDKQYAAIQYAMLWSIYSIKADFFACAGGFIATKLSWTAFFAFSIAVGAATALIIRALVQRSQSSCQGCVKWAGSI
jgi:PAT family beta-lactamase induction signal transducer AmpG